MSMLPTKIYADSYALALGVFTRTKSIPKAQRPTLSRGIEECSFELLCATRATGVAGAVEHKKKCCQRASDALDRLRIYAQLCKDLGFFSEAAYFEISEKSAQVGKQLGGWIKTMGPLQRAQTMRPSDVPPSTK